MRLDAALISACRSAIEAGDLMADGRRPPVAAVEAILGRDVTAEERDAAVAAIETSESSAGGNESMVSTLHDINESGNHGPWIYVGPTVKSPYPVSQYTVFRSLPSGVAEWKSNDRNVNRLFVPVNGLAAARNKLKDEQSALGRAYAVVQTTYGRVN